MQTDVNYLKCITLTTLVKLKPKLWYEGDVPLLSAPWRWEGEEEEAGGEGGIHNQGEAHKAYCNVIEFTPLAVATYHMCRETDFQFGLPG